MNGLKKKNRKSGQAGIEFMICVVVIFFFLFFFLSLSILMVVSDYIEYATFMAARTYRSGYKDKNNQIANAQLVFDSYTQKVQGIGRNFRLDINNDGPDREAGVTGSYDIDLFYLPPLFVKGTAPKHSIRLFSEAHLGRDPGYQECRDFFSKFAAKLGVDLNGLDGEMDDNGC